VLFERALLVKLLIVDYFVLPAFLDEGFFFCAMSRKEIESLENGRKIYLTCCLVGLNAEESMSGIR